MDEFISLNIHDKKLANFIDLIKAKGEFIKTEDWMKDLTIDQLDKAYKVLPSDNPFKDEIAQEIERRLDGEEAVAHKASTDNDIEKAFEAIEKAVDDKIKGGTADNMSVADIAKKHKTTPAKIKEQLKLGIKIEMEHTTDKAKAEEIAMDHLEEIADYYDRLIEMEEEAEDDK